MAMNTDPLQQPRNEIDAIDAQIIELLGRRWQLVGQVSQIKRKHNLPPLQPARFEQLLSAMIEKGKAVGIPEDLVRDIWNDIHKHSRRSQGETDAH